MSRRLKKITLVLILSVFLFVLSGCDLINNLINNISETIIHNHRLKKLLN